MYGSGGRLGLIEISSSTALSAELPMALPDDVLGVVTRIRLPGKRVSVEALDTMLRSGALEAAATQLADADVTLITFACTSASLLHGQSWEQALVDRIQQASGVPATTTASAVVNALRFLDVHRVGVGTPYPDDVNRAERSYLQAAGFEVVTMRGLGLQTDREISRLTLAEVDGLARSVVDTPADALFLSCTNMPTLPLLAELESSIGMPVVSSNSATIWDACRRLGAVSPRQARRLLRGKPPDTRSQTTEE